MTQPSRAIEAVHLNCLLQLVDIPIAASAFHLLLTVNHAECIVILRYALVKEGLA